MNEHRPTYDVRTEPWIQTVDDRGTLVEHSILGVFEHAHELRRLTGEVATQQVAILRLLLAILHRATPVPGRSEEVWRELWDRGSFDLDPIQTYLEPYADRFDLLHPETPFLQVADLHTARGEIGPLSQIIADVPAGAQYLTTRTRESHTTLGLAEATRWLVHTQAFDDSGIKSGAVGDDRVKGGKGYPIGTGWCGAIGPVVVEGATLFETLLLNLRLVRSSARTPDRDSAVWERAPLTSAVEPHHIEPVGVADLLTWPSRRLRLAHDGRRATGVLRTNGDRLHPRNQHLVEPMTAWRRSDAQEKALKLSPVYMPRRHFDDRAVWRGFGGLLALGDDARSSPEVLGPPVLEWVAALQEAGALPSDFAVRVRICGLLFGPNDSTIANLVDDRVELRAALLADAALRRLAIDAVLDVDAGVFAVADLARNLVLAAGGDPEGARARARETAYAAVDPLYRRWVAALGDGTDLQEARTRWQSVLRGLMTRLGGDLVTQAGEAAWIGREIPSGSSTRTMNSGLADRYFRASLRKALELAYPISDHGGTR